MNLNEVQTEFQIKEVQEIVCQYLENGMHACKYALNFELNEVTSNYSFIARWSMKHTGRHA